MFRTRFTLLSALLVALLTLAAPLTAFAQGPLTEEYISPDGALKLLYPAGWAYQEDTGMVALANDPAAFGAALPPGALGVIVIDPALANLMSAGMTVSMEDTLRTFAGELSNGEASADTVTAEQFTFNNRPAVRLVHNGSELDLLLLAIELDDALNVIVTGMSNAGTMGQFESIILSITETIEYSPGGAADLDPVDSIPVLSDAMRAVFTGHTDWVRAVAFSPDSTQVASGADDMTILLWDIVTGEDVVMMSHPDWVYGLAYSPDGTLLASIGSTALYLWDLEAVELAQEMIISESVTNSVAFSPDGTLLATGGDDMIIRLWALDDLSQEPAMIEGHDGTILALAFSPDGSQIASGGAYDVRVWDVATGEVVLMMEQSDWTRSVAFSPDGTLIATGNDDNIVRVFDAATGATVAELEGHTDWIRSVAFGPDSAHIVSGGDDMTVILWALDGRWRGQAMFTGHTDWVRAVAFSPDGAQVASSSDDSTVILWEVP